MQINYIDIQDEIADILRKDYRTCDLKIFVEDSFRLIPDTCPVLFIYLDSWSSKAEDERIGGATPITTFLNIELFIYEFALENRTAAVLRDDCFKHVKEVLKDNRRLNNKVLISRFKGGNFENAKATGGGFFKGVSLTLEIEVRE